MPLQINKKDYAYSPEFRDFPPYGLHGCVTVLTFGPNSLIKECFASYRSDTLQQTGAVNGPFQFA